MVDPPGHFLAGTWLTVERPDRLPGNSLKPPQFSADTIGPGGFRPLIVYQLTGRFFSLEAAAFWQEPGATIHACLEVSSDLDCPGAKPVREADHPGPAYSLWMSAMGLQREFESTVMQLHRRTTYRGGLPRSGFQQALQNDTVLAENSNRHGIRTSSIGRQTSGHFLG